MKKKMFSRATAAFLAALLLIPQTGVYAAEEAGEAERSLIEEKQELAVRHKKFFDSREALGDAINRLDKENYRLNTQI